MTVIVEHAIAGAPDAQSETGFDVSEKMATLAGKISSWNGRQRQRQALADLDSRLLQDIGVTAAQARTEAGKRFWK